MTDRHTPEQRSKNMSAVKASNTRPEILVRRLLTILGYRYRLNNKKLIGRPDITLSKYRTVFFIHGCYWHRHNCYLASMPKSNSDFWEKKFDSNVIRDKNNIQSLLSIGWKVIIVWECCMKGKFKLSEDNLKSAISAGIMDKNNQLIEIVGHAS